MDTSKFEPVKDLRQFKYILVARDDERDLYAADSLDHIRWFASWLADDLYLDLRHTDGSGDVRGLWEFGPREEPDYPRLMGAAETPEKKAALFYEGRRLFSQVMRSKADGF